MTEAGRKVILRAMSRVFHHILKFLATLFGIVALLVMIVAWRLVYVPVDSTSLTPYIEKGLSFLIPHSVAKVGASHLSWDNAKQVLSLSCDTILLSGEDGQPFVSFEKAHLKIKPWHFLGGSLLAQEMTGQKARVYLVRDQNGLVTFGSMKDKPVKPANPVKQAMDFGFLQFIADEIADPKLKHLIEIKDVVFSVKDELFGDDWSVTVPEIRLDHDKLKATGGASVELLEKDRKSYMQVSYAFDQESKLHNISLAIQEVKPSVFAAQTPHLAALKIADFPVSGQVKVSTDRDLNIAAILVELDGGKGSLFAPEMWDKDRSVESLTLRARYDRGDDMLRLSKAEINFGGPRLNVTAEAKIPPPKDLLWLSRKLGNNLFTLKITLDDLPMDAYGSVWPKNILPDARNWIVTGLTKGTFTHGEVTLNGKARLDDLENAVLESGFGKVRAKGGQVNYLKGMPPVENAEAEATFDLDHMDVKILSGHTGQIKVKPFTLVISNFQQDIQEITIPVKLEGPVPDVLRVLDSKPLGYAKAIGLSAEDSDGRVDGVLTLHMPLLDSLKLDDVEVKAKADIRGFAASKLVSGIAITEGNLGLDLTQDGFKLKGVADLNKVPSRIDWTSVFSPGKSGKPLHDATITATLKGSQWGDFYGIDSLAKVVGDTPVVITYTNVRKGLSKVGAQVNLAKAEVWLKDIGWHKPAGENAALSFTLTIPSGKNMVFKPLELSGPSIKVKGNAELDGDSGKLLSLHFKPFVLGRSNATVDYEKPLDPKRPLTLSVEGEAFDLNGLDEAPEEKESAPVSTGEDAQLKEASRPRSYNLHLVKLFTSDDGFMSSVKGTATRDALGWKYIDVWGVAQGVTPVTIKLVPDGERLAFNMNADNFGTALQGLGFGSGIKGGTLEVNGESKKETPRLIEGKIKIGSFVVRDLPVLARLLSAVSPFGFMDLITGDAAFDRLLAHYKWQGAEVELSKLRAAGSVVGINMDGRLNVETGHANLSGTLVPFSFVNSIIGSIPLLGDVITGGSGGGVIAASFKVRGALSDPDISVNPVSLLTPGILRSIFFSSDEAKDEDTEDNTKK
ncbi:MAG: DUF3971 domain-containing protein [Bdellovibrionales bacterium]